MCAVQSYSWHSQNLQIRIHLLFVESNLLLILQITNAVVRDFNETITGEVFKRKFEIIFVHVNIWFQFLFLDLTFLLNK